VPKGALIGDLLDHRPKFNANTRREKLCHMIDGLNQKFGQDTVRFGELPPYRVAYTGAKIAFGRIPDWEDFQE